MLKKLNKGELIFPFIAIVYAFYMVVTQIIEGYHQNVVGYGIFLSLPILIFGLLIIIKTIRQALIDEPKSTEQDSLSDPVELPEAKEEIEEEDDSRFNKKGLLYILGVVILIFLLQHLGYIIGFSAFLLYCMWLMGMRPFYKNVIITVITIALIHFIFVVWLQMPLPKGLLPFL